MYTGVGSSNEAQRNTFCQLAMYSVHVLGSGKLSLCFLQSTKQNWAMLASCIHSSSIDILPPLIMGVVPSSSMVKNLTVSLQQRLLYFLNYLAASINLRPQIGCMVLTPSYRVCSCHTFHSMCMCNFDYPNQVGRGKNILILESSDNQGCLST